MSTIEGHCYILHRASNITLSTFTIKISLLKYLHKLVLVNERKAFKLFVMKLLNTQGQRFSELATIF